MNIENVKGSQDFLGKEAEKRLKVKRIIENTFRLYGFEPAETPIIEYEEFVKGENAQDEAVSDIFKLEDKGKRKLALRYEFTFQLKRISKNQKLPYKRYQIGEVFRDEPISANRFRQFTQCDVDVINSNVNDEAEVLATIKDISKKLNIELTIYINNRRLLNEILEKEKIKDKQEVIRLIDKIEKKSESELKEELKQYNAERILKVFQQPEKFFEKYSSYAEIKELKKVCKNFSVDVQFSPTLARGLSYYTGTIFEAKVKGTKDSVVGGGAYITNAMNCFGYGSGLERWTSLAKIDLDDIKAKYLIVSINQDKEAIELAEDIRSNNIPVILMLNKPLSKALDYANSKEIENVLIIGEKEVKSKKFTLKNMKTGKEKSVSKKELIK